MSGVQLKSLKVSNNLQAGVRPALTIMTDDSILSSKTETNNPSSQNLKIKIGQANGFVIIDINQQRLVMSKKSVREFARRLVKETL